MLIRDGFLDIEEVKVIPGFPSEESFKKGPVAVIECAHEIPCNPCEDSCKFGAIHVGNPITNLPRIEAEKCVACGQCVISCPGLACFIVDKTYSEDEATVTFPYEYFPLPKEGDTVKAVARSGKEVCDAKVIKVRLTKASDHTPAITIAVKKEYADVVRSMKRLNAIDNVEPKIDFNIDLDKPIEENVLVCRCEEITYGEIKEAIREGARDVNGVKRRTRAGMGLCQGRSCEKIVQAIIRQELKEMPEEIGLSTARPPVKPISFAALAGGKANE